MLSKVLVKPNGVIITVKGIEPGDHLVKECPTLWGDLEDVMKVANEGFQLAMFTKTFSGPLVSEGNNPISLLSW